MENNKKIIDLGIIPELEVSGVKKISLVEEPAIELDFLYFKKEEFVTPNAGESDDEFISRCIPFVIAEGKEADQAAAICYSYLEEKFIENKDPKGVGTAKGKATNTRSAEVSKQAEETLQKKSDEFNEKNKDKLGYGVDVGMLKTVYQRGKGAFNSSHRASVSSAEQWALARVNAYLYLVKNGRPENKNYKQDNDLLPAKHPKKDEGFAADLPHYTEDGKLWTGATHTGADGRLMTGATHTEDSEYLYHEDSFESYNDYPESAKNAAKRALAWKADHPDQGCGTLVGWARANQLAKGENISEETIARMASFARHLQYKDVPYSEGCGGLMVDAWGGQAGIEWASNKLQEIRQDFEEVNPDKEMVDGIIDLLNDVEDLDNRLAMAQKITEQFIEEGVQFDLANFMNRIGFHNFDIDTSSLTPYVDQVGTKKKIEDILTAEQLETILEMASVLGVHESEVDYVSAFQFALNPKDAAYTPARTITKADGEEVVYKYMSSRVAGNSRQFCSRMMGLSRFYTREEIDALDTFNQEFGPGVGGGQYSIFKYKGGVNCQHYWQKYIAQRVGRRLQVTEAEPTDNIQQVAETAPRTTQGRGYVKRPERNLAPLAGHSAFSKLQFNFADEEQKIVVGPAMLPNISIPRKDEETGDLYWVKFSADTIKEIAMKYMKEARTNEVNTDHEVNDAGTYIFESWIVEDPEHDKANTTYGYNVPKGTWMVSMKVDDKETWRRIKNGELKGFSVEGSFSDMEEIENQKRYNRIVSIIKG